MRVNSPSISLLHSPSGRKVLSSRFLVWMGVVGSCRRRYCSEVEWGAGPSSSAWRGEFGGRVVARSVCGIPSGVKGVASGDSSAFLFLLARARVAGRDQLLLLMLLSWCCCQ